MYSSIKVMTIFVILLVSVVQNEINKDLEMICRSRSLTPTEAYNRLSNLIEFYQSEDPLEDCDHSVGFHLTKQFCEKKGLTPWFEALTAYFTEKSSIALIFKFDVKEDKKDLVTNFIFTIHSSVKQFSYGSLFVVWIREPIISEDFSHNYKISYFSNDGKQNTIQTKDLKQTLRKEEQILVTDIQMKEMSQNIEYRINITSEVPTEKKGILQYFVDDSYIIFCLERDLRKRISENCKPIVIEDHGISCECDPKDQLTTIIIMFVFWFIVSIISIRPLISLLTDKREKERTDFPMMISCNQRNSKFEYVICLRFAKTTPDFDLKDVNIDVEFLTASNENVAPVFRFRANVLENQLLTQIRIFMWRLTKMPELKKVQCRHSGISDGKIILFGVYISCRKGVDEDLKVYKINKNIVRESRMFPMIKGDAKDDQLFEDEEKQIQSLTNFPINYSFLEKIWIFFVIISLIAFTAAIFPLNWLFGSGNGLVSVLLKMLVLTSISSLVAIVFHIPFTYIYRFLILSELRQQARMESTSYEKIFFVLIRVYYIISIIVSVILGLFISFQKTKQKTVDTYKWFCVTFCATALFALIWIISSHLTLFSLTKVPTEASEGLDDASLSAIDSGSQTSREVIPIDKNV